jgi:hypothetical protein
MLLLAYLIQRDGDDYLPLYEKLEIYLVELRNREGAKDRARRLLESYSRAGQTKTVLSRDLRKRFGTRNRSPQIVSTDAIAAELGEWARGYALDQRLSGAKARRELGWSPRHLDPVCEIERP